MPGPDLMNESSPLFSNSREGEITALRCFGVGERTRTSTGQYPTRPSTWISGNTRPVLQTSGGSVGTPRHTLCTSVRDAHAVRGARRGAMRSLYQTAHPTATYRQGAVKRETYAGVLADLGQILDSCRPSGSRSVRRPSRRPRNLSITRRRRMSRGDGRPYLVTDSPGTAGGATRSPGWC